MTAPLHCQGPQAPRPRAAFHRQIAFADILGAPVFGGLSRRVVEPERSGIPGAREWLRQRPLVVARAARTDEQIGGEVEAAERLVPEEERANLTLSDAAGRTEGAHRNADQIERHRLRGRVEDFTDLADAESLRGPDADVFDPHEPSV